MELGKLMYLPKYTYSFIVEEINFGEYVKQVRLEAKIDSNKDICKVSWREAAYSDAENNIIAAYISNALDEKFLKL